MENFSSFKIIFDEFYTFVNKFNWFRKFEDANLHLTVFENLNFY